MFSFPLSSPTSDLLSPSHTAPACPAARSPRAIPLHLISPADSALSPRALSLSASPFRPRSQLADSVREELNRSNLAPKDLCPRICAALRVESVFIRAAQNVAQRFAEQEIAIDANVTKHQTSMAAAFVWLVLQLRADAPRVVRLLEPSAPDPDAREAWLEENKPQDIDWDRSTTKRQARRSRAQSLLDCALCAAHLSRRRHSALRRGAAQRHPCLADPARVPLCPPRLSAHRCTGQGF